jgi:signal transduction histidine kinase
VNGRYEFVNPRLEANAGRLAAEIVGRTTEEVFPSDIAAVFVAHDCRVAETGEAVTETEYVREPDGRQRPCLVVRFPLDAPDGRRLGGFSLDMSEVHRLQEEQRKVEKQMLQAQKLESLGVLAGGIAHDFNNLLTGVLGYASLARMDGSLSADTDGHLRQIEAAAQRAGELCKQMLAYAGRGQFVVGEVDLNALVAEMSQLLAAAVSKRAVLKLNLTDPLPPVRADATQLRQVVMNLITNASDAIAERSGVVTVSTGLIDADPVYLTDIGCSHLPPRTYVYLEVSDTGVGMTEEVKARVFEPFFTTKFTGRGLGLAAVQGIVRAHGGAIKIYTNVGKGTTFKVLLPASEGVREAVAAPPLPVVAGAGKWVLVVDDEEDVRVLARKVLTHAGFQVETAADGREGVDTFRASPGQYAAVLLDLTMPRMNGTEAFRQMRVIRPEVRVILTSGYAAEDATTGFEGKGLAGFVRKPFRVGELLAAVAEAVGP